MFAYYHKWWYHVIMLFSKSWIQTLREVPNDVDTDNISQVLMARAGLVKRMSNGLYVHTPLMLSVMGKVKDEIRRQTNAIECYEVKFPILVQRTDLEESGRWDVFGNEIFKLKDRNGKDMALSPTNEEAACFMARQHIKSHNQLPLALFQIQKKYRDEISPRGGIMRGREFTMYDAYTFHATEKCMMEYFNKMQDAYSKAFKNLGLKFVHVTADNGAMGGKASREFMAISENGTDTIAMCTCGEAHNTEMSGDNKICKCGNPYSFHKGCEIGHIFALGQHYSKKLNLNYTDQNGKLETLYMGCFGMGIDRIVAMIVEQHHDANGIKWPESLAPIKYNIITLSMDDAELVRESEKLYREYLTKGESVMWDDRSVSIGVKLKDSDLLGIPNKIVVSKKGVSHEKR
jgi:prolyl-tRNA synthetase